MRRLIVLFLLLAPAAFPYASYSGFCEQGGQKTIVGGQASATYLQQSYPNFTQSGAGPSVTVYATGTTNKVTLYSDALGTSLANPFPCLSNGQYQFFTASNVVDILFSGAGISSFTRAAIPIQDPLQFVSDINGLTIAQNCTQATSRGATLMLSQKWDLNGTCAANIQAVSGGGFAPGSGHTTTLTGSFSGDLTQHVDLSAGGSVLFTGPVAAFYPQWFGPSNTCTGPLVDSTVAVQAAVDASINSSVSRTVVLVGSGTTPSCGISSLGPGGAGGLTLYPQNAAMTLTSNASIQTGAYVPGTGGGLVATTSNPPTTLLTVFAPSIKLTNLYLDGNNRAATRGVEFVYAANSTISNLIVREFSGDGGQLFNEGTPQSHLTGNTTAGSNTVLTVNATTVNRYAMGTYYCGLLDINYGGGTEEIVSISSISGLNVTVASTAHNHSANETVQCHGNSNEMHFDHFVSYANGGWGWDLMPGADNNSQYWADGSSNNNALGGELWSGGSHIHIGGNYEGDGGPAVQLGDVTGKYVTHFMVVGPLSDIEESNSNFNVVNAVCDDSSSVTFKLPTQLTINTGSGVACPAYSVGTTTTGYGTGVEQVLYVKNISGTAKYGPGAPLISTSAAWFYKTPNIAVECTGVGTPDPSCPGASANGALVATLRDGSGNLVTQANGLRITIAPLAHTLTGSSTEQTLQLNGGSVLGIADHLNPSNSIDGSYVVSGAIDLLYNNGDWLDMGQK